MVCRNYRFMYEKEVEGVKKSVVYVELISDTTPSPLPTTPYGIEGFPLNYTADNVLMGAGSVLYVVSSGDAYMLNTQGTFVKQ